MFTITGDTLAGIVVGFALGVLTHQAYVRYAYEVVEDKKPTTEKSEQQMNTKHLVYYIKEFNKLGEQMCRGLESSEKTLTTMRENGMISGNEKEYLFFKYLEESHDWSGFLNDVGHVLQGTGTERTALFLEEVLWGNKKLLSEKFREITSTQKAKPSAREKPPGTAEPKGEPKTYGRSCQKFTAAVNQQDICPHLFPSSGYCSFFKRQVFVLGSKYERCAECKTKYPGRREGR